MTATATPDVGILDQVDLSLEPACQGVACSDPIRPAVLVIRKLCGCSFLECMPCYKEDRAVADRTEAVAVALGMAVDWECRFCQARRFIVPPNIFDQVFVSVVPL